MCTQMTVIAVRFLSPLVLFAGTLLAQETEVKNDEKVPPAWFARLEGGGAKIHEVGQSGAWIGLDVGR